MSRHLPPRPNLEFLRNQAKEMLPRLQQQNVSSKLADAQHALALEYGFPNWPALKAHVEALTHTSPFAGTWSIDQSKSSQRPDASFTRATLQFDVRDDAITITDVVVDGSGREERGVNTIHADGRQHISQHGYGLTARWRGAHVLEIVTSSAGHEVSRMIYEVTRGLDILTLSATAVAHAGYPAVEQLTVFNRVTSDSTGGVDGHLVGGPH